MFPTFDPSCAFHFFGRYIYIAVFAAIATLIEVHVGILKKQSIAVFTSAMRTSIFFEITAVDRQRPIFDNMGQNSVNNFLRHISS